MTGIICKIRNSKNTNETILILHTGSDYVACLLPGDETPYIIGRKISVIGSQYNNKVFIGKEWNYVPDI